MWNEIWLMEPTALSELLASMEQAQQKRVSGFTGFVGASWSSAIVGKTSVIDVRGPITKQTNPFLDWLGVQYASTQAIGTLIDEALADDSIKEIRLVFETSGGQIAGIQELSDKIYSARQSKKVIAPIEDICASAGYWLAAQATEINANESALIGSIGVAIAVRDDKDSNTRVVSSHELKGGGLGGSYTEAQIKDLQRVVTDLKNLFVAQVARGRDMDANEIEHFATGQVWLASEASKKGLIDNVRKVEAPKPNNQTDNSMAKTATFNPSLEKIMDEELKAAQEELAVLRATTTEQAEKIKELEAEGAASKTALEAAKSAQRDTLIANYRNRVTPAMRESIEDYAATVSFEKLEVFLKNLPVAVNAEPVGGSGDPDEDEKDDHEEDVKRSKETGLDLTAEDYEKYGKAEGFDVSTGEVI